MSRQSKLIEGVVRLFDFGNAAGAHRTAVRERTDTFAALQQDLRAVSGDMQKAIKQEASRLPAHKS